MNYHFIQNPDGIIPKAYNPDVLEGNWYEDRCLSEFDENKKKNYLLPNANAWQYDKTYNELGQNWKDFPKTHERFSESNDNCINFQDKDNKMYVTTYKHAFDEKYRETFRQPIDMKDYYKDKKEELEEYRASWTKRGQNFETTYKSDILSKTVKETTK